MRAAALLCLAAVAPLAAAASTAPPTLVYAPCNASDASQTGFTFPSGTVQFGGLCVAFDVAQGYNAPLSLRPCDASAAQAWVYDAAAQSLRNPSATCGGPSGACIEWSGQEYGACTSTPPALGPGCIIGSWPSPASPQTSWNDQYVLDSPSQGMIAAAATTASSSSGGSGLCVAVRTPPPPPPPPVPTADILAWSRREVMCLYDIDMCTYVGSQGCQCSAAPPPVSTWAPSALDTDS